MYQAFQSHRLGVALSSLLLFAAAATDAQDSFGPSGQQQPRYPQQQASQQHAPQQPYPAQSQRDPYSSQQPDMSPDPRPQQMPGMTNEAQDFGVRPTGELRPTQQLHGPTPTSIPGGRVIGTQQLVQLLQGQQGKVLLLDVYGGPQHIPGAVPVGPAAQGGSFNDEVQQGFGQYLGQVTGGDTARVLVTYCGGVQCWSSYNAALRAMKLGYRNVAWYRGGIEAWQQSGLPLQSSGGGGPQPQPQAQQQSGGRQW